MTSSNRRFFSGSTVEQAVMSAASVHEVDPEDLAYKQVEKRHGFLRMRRRVMIEVDPQNLLRSEQPAPAPAPEPTPQAAPQPPSESEPSDSAPSFAPAPAEEDLHQEMQPEPAAEPPADAEPAAESAAEPAADSAAERADQPDRDSRGGRGRGGRRRGGRGRGGRGRGGRGRGGDRRESQRAEGQGGGRRRGGPRRDSKPVERRPQEPFEPTPEMHTAAADAVDRLAQLARLRVAAEVRNGEDRLELELAGPDQDRLTSEDGEVLLALEQLVPRVMRGLIGVSAPVRLDCDDFRSEAEAALRAQARFAAEEVQRTGRETVLDPMAPAERRIIHMTLAEDSTVETESEGDGYFKRVTVRPL